MDCPRCGDRLSELVLSMPSQSINIDRCLTCDGYWFDGNELPKVISESEMTMEEGTGASSQDRERLRCPRCGCDMTKNVLFEVEIDRCPECCGIWLDRGELYEVQRRYRDYERNKKLIDMIDRLTAM